MKILLQIKLLLCKINLLKLLEIKGSSNADTKNYGVGKGLIQVIFALINMYSKEL
jgi:hypothetical protein